MLSNSATGFVARSLAIAVLTLGLGWGLAPSAAAQGMETSTVQVGQPAPDFELRDAHGTAYRLSELVERGPVVLEFFRSGGW